MTSLAISVARAAGCLVALATLPGTIELFVLTLGALLPAARTKGLAGTETSRPLRIAFVIPAHDEEASIAGCVQNVLQCAAGQHCFVVFVIADNCSDQTAVRAERAGATVLVRQDAEHRGKGYALDFAFEKLMSDHGKAFDLFVVVDADTTVTPNLVREFAEACAQGAKALQCRYKVRNAQASARTRWMNVALMAFNVARPRGRSRWGMSAGILGNGFALTRSTLESVPYRAASVVEDLEYHLRLVKAGVKVRFLDTVTVYGEMPITGKGVVTQRSRWEGGRLRMVAQFAPELAKECLSGRIRFLEPLLELLLLPLSFHVTLLVVALATPLALVRGYAASALALVLVHQLGAIAIAGGHWRDVMALFSAPLYVLWKLRMIPQLLRNARKSTAWVRTARADSQGGTR